jgi:large subunit ribosomal protein L20
MQINAGAREYQMRYSQLINGLSLANIGLNRKVLSQLAIQEPYSFRAVLHEAKAAIERKAAERAAAGPPQG